RAGGSILITSAPNAASQRPQKAGITPSPSSTTVRPSSARGTLSLASAMARLLLWCASRSAAVRPSIAAIPRLLCTERHGNRHPFRDRASYVARQVAPRPSRDFARPARRAGLHMFRMRAFSKGSAPAAIVSGPQGSGADPPRPAGGRGQPPATPSPFKGEGVAGGFPSPLLTSD